jgi:STE24 endopeptidase
MFVFFTITTPLVNTFSRKLERDADRFALENTKNAPAFISSMNRLADQNLADRNPSPVIEFLLHSHPSIGKRIEMARKFQPNNMT